MKKLLFGSLVFGLVFLPRIASADLTSKDMEGIRKIVMEEIQRESAHINQRIDGINQRIDDTNQRIEDTNRRIDDLDSKLSTRLNDLMGLLYVILAGMIALVGFVLWDRRSALQPAITRLEALKVKEESVEEALRIYSRKEPELASALRLVGLGT